MVLNFRPMRSQPIDGSPSTLPSQTPMHPGAVGAPSRVLPGSMGVTPTVPAAVLPLSGVVPPLPPARLAPPPSRGSRAARQSRSRSASRKRRAVNPGGRTTAVSAGPTLPPTLDTLAVALAVCFKTLDGKLNKLQATVDGISSVASAESNKTDNLTVLAESMTAAQSATSTALAEFKEVTYAAAATLRDAPRL